MASPQPAVASRADDAPWPGDEEWEYEYSTTETEDYYMIVDLSSAVPPRPKVKAGSSRRAAAEPEAETEAPGPSQDSIAGTPQESRETSPGEPASEVQILDLHTANPIISYQNQVYSCNWATSLGTDLIFAPPSTVDDTVTPLKSTPSYDLIAATPARLIGQPVTLLPKQSYAQERGKRQRSATESEEPLQGAAAQTAFKIPVGPSSGRQRHEQARFLERLMSIKQEKGEKDYVTVFAHKGGRRAAMEGSLSAGGSIPVGDMEVGGTLSSTTTRGRPGRPRGRKRGRRRSRTSFFGRERETTEDGSQAESIATPRTWNELDSQGASISGRETRDQGAENRKEENSQVDIDMADAPA